MASVIIVDINLRLLRVGEGCHALPQYRIQRLVSDVRIRGSKIGTHGQPGRFQYLNCHRTLANLAFGYKTSA